MRVLIVDDEHQIRRGIMEGLDWESLGFDEIAGAANGLEALEQIRLNRPNLVITDIRMPVMDGLELSRRIREQDGDIRIVILSGHQEFDYARQALQSGVKHYELKPVKLNHFLLMLREIRQELEEDRANKAKRTEMEIALFWERVYRGEHKERSQVERLLGELYGMAPSPILVCLAVECEEGPADLRGIAEAGKPDSLIYQLTPSRFLIVANAPSAEKERLERWADHKLDELASSGMRTKAFGMSGVGDASRLSELARQAERELDNRPPQESALFEAKGRTRHSPAIAGAIRYMKNHIQDPLSAEKMAELAEITPNYFSHLFKKETGVAFSDFLNRLRVEEARKLLNTTNMMIYEISERVGFLNYKYFNAVFRKVTGVSPSESRRQPERRT